jgi:hypothetical protein
MTETTSQKSNGHSSYWHCYGGWKAFFTSGYLWSSFIVALLIVVMPKNKPMYWQQYALTILPALLAVSLTGFAVIVAFFQGRDDPILKSGTHTAVKVSPYLKVSGSFAHFIRVQVFVLGFALLFDDLKEEGAQLTFFGIWGLLYAISLTLSVVEALFLFSWVDDQRAP